VKANNKRRMLEVTTSGGRVLAFPYAKLDPHPTPADPIVDVGPDKELGREAATFTLRSGREGSVHMDTILESNHDPKALAEAIAYRLTLEAERHAKLATLGKREIAKRLGTSPAQLYRLLDPKHRPKTINQVVALLDVLGLKVSFTVEPREHGRAESKA
jgi:DNA-binding phage protein